MPQRVNLKHQNRMLKAACVVAQGLADAPSLADGYRVLLDAIHVQLGWKVAALWLVTDGTLQRCEMYAPESLPAGAVAAVHAEQALVQAAWQNALLLRADHEPRTAARTPGSVFSYRRAFALPLLDGTLVTAVLQLFSDVKDLHEREAVETLQQLCARFTKFSLQLRQRQAQAAEFAVMRATLSAQAQRLRASELDFCDSLGLQLHTSLHAIIRMTELAARTSSAAEQQEYLARVKSSAEELSQWVSSALELSQLRANRVKLAPELFVLPALLSDVTATIAKRLTSGSVELVVAVSPQVPEQVFGDPQRLRQILIHLLDNAVKFTTQGVIHCLVEPVVGATSPWHLHFRVTDTGMGIPQHLHSQVFQFFFQVDSSASRRPGGAGIGLALCRALVERLGGRIWFESVPGQGSQFCFELSLAPPTALPVPQPGVGSGQRILVIDGNHDVCADFTSVLKVSGFSVGLAADGPSATALLLHPDNRCSVAPIDESLLVSCAAALEALRIAPQQPTVPLPAQRGANRAASDYRYEFLLMPTADALLRDAGVSISGLPAVTGKSELPALPVASKLFYQPRVLVVDDNLENQLLYALVLNRSGYRAEVVGSGRLALASTEAVLFDLIFMDIEMPGFDGIATATEIRRREVAQGRARVPIVAISANATESYRSRSLHAGMNDFQTKPISQQRLLSLAAQWVDRRPFVLFVEPDRSELLRMCEELRATTNCRFLPAASGNQSVELLRDHTVALVVVNIETLMQDGRRVAVVLRELSQGMGARCIGLTGSDNSAPLVSSLAAECAASLSTPVPTEGLRRGLEHVLDTLAHADQPVAVASAPALAPSALLSASTTSVQRKRVVSVRLDDQDILDLLPGFLESCQQSIQELPRLLSERAWAAIAITGHNIKGTATSFGCGMLGDIAGQLERAAHSHDVVETEGRVGDLQTCLQHWISELPLP